MLAPRSCAPPETLRKACSFTPSTILGAFPQRAQNRNLSPHWTSESPETPWLGFNLRAVPSDPGGWFAGITIFQKALLMILIGSQ